MENINRARSIPPRNQKAEITEHTRSHSIPSNKLELFQVSEPSIIFMEKLLKWVNEAPTDEKQSRKVAKERIINAYNQHLTTLDLSNLALTSLPPAGTLNKITALTVLDLSRNQISTIPANAWTGLNNLNVLNLSENQISIIPANAWTGLNNLTELDLSRNQISTIPANAWTGLNSLTGLDLSRNQISTIPANAWTGLNSLTGLYLSENQISTIPANAWTCLNSLTELYLSKNQISTIPANAWTSLNSLIWLYLNENQISIIPANAWTGLNSLNQLNLNENQISTIPSNAWTGLNSLTELNLSRNQISTILANAWTGLNSLIGLNLSRNQISTIPANAWTGLNSLTELNLSRNQISTILANAWTGLSSLTGLNLSRNQISTIPANAWTELSLNCRIFPEHLRTMSFFENKLTDILTQVDMKHAFVYGFNQVNNEFKTFIDRIHEISDMKSPNIDIKKSAYRELAKILIQMDKNNNIRENCINIAITSLENCGDAINIGFLRMQIIANKLDYSNQELSTLYNNQKKLAALEYVIKDIVGQKLLSLSNQNPQINNPDTTEVGLAYLKGLKDELDITISGMLYDSISHVTTDDIVKAKNMLHTYLSNEDNVYSAMIDSDVIKAKFKNEFEAIQNKSEYDTDYSDGENGQEYMKRLNIITQALKSEKIEFLKKQNHN